MPAEPAKPLRIFLSYARADAAAVRKLHRYLRDKGFDVWFDKESLVPGQDWQIEIEHGLNRSDVILVCLSQAAVSKEGFVQKEIKFALDRALEMPEGRIFLIPVRLQPCEAPTRLNRYHWVDLFEREGYSRLMRGLKYCAEQLARARVDESQPVNSIPDQEGNVGQASDVAALKNADVGKTIREQAEAKKITQEKIEQERIAREKRARAQTWANLKKTALLFGGALLLGAGCLAVWLVWQALPGRAAPTATIEMLLAETRPPASLTPAPPTDIPFTPMVALTPTPAAGDMMVSAQDGMKLHYVPAGPFTMGSDTYADEKPIHTVTLSAFWIDETEVTNQMYALCVKAGKCQPPGNKSSSKRPNYYDDAQYADYPVIYVSWNDATAYCSWAGRTLPSEAQWEKAARGPNGNTYPWGNGAPNKGLSNYNQNVGDTTQVGQYPNGKSFYGAQDMAGNVWEWVEDWYSDTYYASSPSTNPPGPVSGQHRVLRGGSRDYLDDYVRSAVRLTGNPGSRLNFIGFRCALLP